MTSTGSRAGAEIDLVERALAIIDEETDRWKQSRQQMTLEREWRYGHDQRDAGFGSPNEVVP
jgi:hypothetical protein